MGYVLLSAYWNDLLISSKFSYHHHKITRHQIKQQNVG